jgi:subtilisin family serine protease
VRIGPNLVFCGEQAYQGFPGGWPTPVTLESADFVGEDEGPIVAILDTGYTSAALGGVHGTDGLDGRFGDWGPPGTPEEMTPTGWRDFEAGHSTFICGIIAERARRSRLRVIPTLRSDGYVEEVELVRKLKDLDDDVNIVNLSLGGFSADDFPPVALAEAIATLPPEIVVLAAAGNAGRRTRPFWPAQLDRETDCEEKTVFAIGAKDEDGVTSAYSTEPADIYAPGRSVSAFIEFNEKNEHPGAEHGRDPEKFEGYASWAGTSFATGVVAAAIAEGMNGGGSALEVARTLCRNGTPIV